MLHGVTMNIYDVVLFVHLRTEVHRLLSAWEEYSVYIVRVARFNAQCALVFLCLCK
jgi:hypothetical protein